MTNICRKNNIPIYMPPFEIRQIYVTEEMKKCMKRRKYIFIFGRKSSERPETVYTFICREAWSRPKYMNE